MTGLAQRLGAGLASGELFARYGLYVFFALLVAAASIASPAFLSVKNIQNILTEGAPLGMVVIGQMFVILVRGLDLSVASLMATVAVIGTEFNAQSDAMVPVIFAVCLAFSVLVGLTNGLLVTKRRVSPFLATLAMMIVLQGLRFAMTKGAPSGALPEGFRTLGTGLVLGLPINLVALALLAVVFGLLLHRTAFGRRVYMVGGNPRASALVGVDGDRVTILCYVISSVCACLGGLFLVGYVGSVDNWVGQGYELQSIAAAVMGGIALTGGRGAIGGALVGALILIVLFNIVLLLGFPVEMQYILQGVIIVAGAAFYTMAGRRT